MHEYMPHLIITSLRISHINHSQALFSSLPSLARSLARSSSQPLIFIFSGNLFRKLFLSQRERDPKPEAISSVCFFVLFNLFFRVKIRIPFHQQTLPPPIHSSLSVRKEPRSCLCPFGECDPVSTRFEESPLSEF